MNNLDTYTYRPLRGGNPLGGIFFFVIGSLGIVLEGALYALDIGTLHRVSSLGATIFLLYSLLFLVIGAIILFYRKSYLFDREAQLLTPLVKLPLLTIRGKAISYSMIDAVQISRKVIGSGSNVGLLFSVSLIQGDRKSIPLETFYRYPNAKRVSELLSKALMRPLHDNSSGRIVVRPSGDFRETLQERVEVAGFSEEPLKPKDLAAVVNENLGKIQIRIPPFGILDALFTLLIPSLIIFLFFAWISFAVLRTLPFEIIAYSLTVPTVFILVAGSFLFREEYIDLDREHISIFWRFAFFSQQHRIPLKELESLYVIGKDDEDERLQFLKALTRTESYGKQKDLFYPFRCLSSTIIARSGSNSIPFGRSLDIEELTYLVYLIEIFLKNGTLREE
ncbi:hypothetical protein MRY87_02550 [bacterium]|nr:hypothetical protein [bacterium]